MPNEFIFLFVTNVTFLIAILAASAITHTKIVSTLITEVTKFVTTTTQTEIPTFVQEDQQLIITSYNHSMLVLKYSILSTILNLIQTIGVYNNITNQLLMISCAALTAYIIVCSIHIRKIINIVTYIGNKYANIYEYTKTLLDDPCDTEDPKSD